MQRHIKKFVLLTSLAIGIATNSISAINHNIAALHRVHAETAYLNADKTITYSLNNGILHIKNSDVSKVMNESLAASLKANDVDLSMITQVVFDDKVVFSSFNSMFKDMKNLTTIDWTNVYPATQTQEVGGTNVEVNIVRDYSKMFYNCRNLETVDLSALFGGTYMDGVSVSNDYGSWQKAFDKAFFGCSKLTSVEFENVSLAYMFCYNFRSVFLPTACDDKAFDGSTTVFSFGNYDNRNYYYDWSCYSIMSNSDSNGNEASSVARSTSVQKRPVKFNLEVGVPVISDNSVGYNRKIYGFTVDNSIVELPIDDPDDRTQPRNDNVLITSYMLDTNNPQYQGVKFNTHLLDTFNNFTPRRLLDSFVFAGEDGKTRLQVLQPYIDSFQICCDIKDLVIPLTGDSTYVVRFEGAFSNYDPIVVRKGDAVTNLPVPDIRGGGYFVGWYSSEGELIENGYVPTSNLYLYGSFTGSSYTRDPEDKPADEKPQEQASEEQKQGAQQNNANSNKTASTETTTPNTSSATTETLKGGNSSTGTTTTTSSPSTITLDKVKGLKVATGRKKIKLSWKKVNKASSYTIQVAKNKAMKKKCKTYSTATTKKTIKMKKGKYFVRVRAVSSDSSSKWTKVKKILVK